jgi:hypothetical protein
MAMPLGRGIVEVFEAIPDRIEVSGHGPTWRVTGGSFESVLSFAREAFGETVVLAREDRSRWWPRVTLTLTQDPVLAATAPPTETFSDPVVVEPAESEVLQPASAPADAERDTYPSRLEEIFAHQEELRLARRRIPEQRGQRS